MYPGETLLIISTLACVANCIWAIVNLRRGRETLQHFQLANRLHLEAITQAKEIRQKAVDDVLAFRAGEFKVCGLCGKIVQGVCLECTMAVKG